MSLRVLYRSTLLSALMLLSAWAAFAQVGAPSSCSGTATVTAANITFPGSGKTGPTFPSQYLTIVNPNSGTIWINPVGTAVANGGDSIPILSNGSVSWSQPNNAPPATVSIISPSGSQAYTCLYR